MPLDAIYLSRDELVGIHDRLIRRYGGMPDIHDEGLLDSCLAQPKTFVFDVERFPTLVDKAAAYCFFITRNHPFFDANKRTGFVAALHFLRINNVPVRFNDDEAYNAILGVANGKLALEDVASMIASAVERARPPLGNGP